jgi:hypothetical protein
MNKEITINYLPHGRFRYAPHFINEIIKVKDSIKDLIKINLMFSHPFNDEWQKMVDFLKNHGIYSEYFVTDGGHYMNKIKTASENSGKYAVKCDEEIFLNAKGWEYFLENSKVLENDENLFLAPIITNGIPTVDMFIKQFFDEKAKKEIHDLFLKVPFENEWGVDYSSLRKYVTEANEWIPDNFYEGIKQINHHYKGIHPIRLSGEAQYYMVNYILNNFQRFMDPKDYSISEVNRPYHCNSIFLIKNETWKKILYNQSLFRDDFDEVPLNLYKQFNNLKMLFINNCFAVHPSYNTIDGKGFSYSHLSDAFFNHPYFIKN